RAQASTLVGEQRAVTMESAAAQSAAQVRDHPAHLGLDLVVLLERLRAHVREHGLVEEREASPLWRLRRAHPPAEAVEGPGVGRDADALGPETEELGRHDERASRGTES